MAAAISPQRFAALVSTTPRSARCSAASMGRPMKRAPRSSRRCATSTPCSTTRSARSSPICSTRAGGAAAPAAVAHTAYDPNVRVLLIDDDARLAELLVGYLGPQGVTLVHA